MEEFAGDHLVAEGYEDRISNDSLNYRNPSVAAVTCFYNEEEVVKSTLEHIDECLEESESIESWYLVDDGSTDETSEILQSYAEESGSAKFVSMGENTGKFQAQKEATEKVEEDYWLSIDADSYIDNPEDFDYFVNDFDQNDEVAAMLRIEPEASEEEGMISRYTSTILRSMQKMEYEMRFGVDSYTANDAHSKIITASGTATIGETDSILDAMEYHTGEYAGDDRQLTSIIELKQGKEIGYYDDTSIVTDCPNSFKELLDQRSTWAEGRINAVSAHPKEHLKGLAEGTRYSQILGSDLAMASSTPVFAYKGIEAAATGDAKTLIAGYGLGLGLTSIVYANARYRNQTGSQPLNPKEIAKDTPKIMGMPLYQSAIATPTIINSFKEKFVKEPVKEFRQGYRDRKF